MTREPDLRGLTGALDSPLPSAWSILRDTTSEAPYLFELVHSGTSPGYFVAAAAWVHASPGRACANAERRRIPLEAAAARERWESTFDSPECIDAFHAAKEHLHLAIDLLRECNDAWCDRASDHDDEPPDDDGLDPFLHGVLRACGESMVRLDRSELFGRGAAREP